MNRTWASVDLHVRALMARAVELAWTSRGAGRPRLPRARPLRRRKLMIGVGLAVCLVGIPIGALWWRLGSGPLSVDIATPWLTSALEERFGGRHHIEVGGTQIERTEEGHAALRMRDIVVRDPDGTIVASAPKAEVGLSGGGLLTGHLQATRLSLIGAAMAIRVERNGELTIFAGADKRPIATASVAAKAQEANGGAGSSSAPSPALNGARPGSAQHPRPGANSAAPPSVPAAAASPAPEVLTTLLSWLDRLDVLGLDGHDLTEVGLKNGSLVVDDARTGKRWTFSDINLALTRPKEGGIAFAVNSTGSDGRWSLTATVTPRGNGRRAVEAVLRDLPTKNLLLAMRVDDSNFEAKIPISGIMRGEIGPNGVLESAEGRILFGGGYIGSPKDEDDRIAIDQAHVDLRWDAGKRQLTFPIELTSGPNQISLLGQIDAPRETGGPWQFAFNRGQFMLISTEHIREAPLVLDRVAMTGRYDPARRRIELDHGDVSGPGAGLAFSGALDLSGADPRVIGGMAGTRMTSSSLKRIWPVFIQTKVRKWVIDHIPGGTVERLTIAVNAPISTLRAGGPPVPDDGISIELASSGAQVRPIETLPIIRDSDLILRVAGRHATVTLGHGIADLPGGRKLTVSNVVFEVPDTFPKDPPARMRFHVDGAVDAVAELMAMEPLRDACGLQLDPATSRGTVAANVTLGLPITHVITQDKLTYGVEAEFTNFSAERLVRNQKVEAALLHISASPQGILIKGDARIGGTLASIEYRVPIGAGDADIRAQAIIDDNARGRVGMELNGALGGAIPLKVVGKIGSGERDSRFVVEADLTQAKIADLLPGWIKPAGKAARANFVIVDKSRAIRFEDIVVDGPGTSVKGTVELDNEGEIALANFPTFNLSGDDRASLKAERSPEGVLKVTMRGEVFDGRGFVKGAMSNASDKQKASAPARDLDLDIKVRALAGFNGEALRDVDLKLSRRGGQIRTFSLSTRLGRDATLLGDMRVYPNGRNVIYLETNDAGALCRFTDTYPRIVGGHLWVAMDPPAADQAPRDGILNVRQFIVRGEPALEQIASGGDQMSYNGTRYAGGNLSGVSFSNLRVDFTRYPGKLTIRDGVVFGDTVGATLDGVLDYAQDRVKMHGTFIPLYGINNLFVHLPLVGPILGSENEGLFGVTYEVVGTPHAPELNVNIMSPLAIGPFRKLFEFRANEGTTPVPQRLPGRE